MARLENIENDFKIICLKLDFGNQKLLHKNKSKRAHWVEYYSSNTKEIVYRLYKKDFELLGYDR